MSGRMRSGDPLRMGGGGGWPHLPGHDMMGGAEARRPPPGGLHLHPLQDALLLRRVWRHTTVK